MIDSPHKEKQETAMDTTGVRGAGIVVTDGRFVYIKRWASYTGSHTFYKFGTGNDHTEFGKNYGPLAQASISLSSTYFSDGNIYNPIRTNSKKLEKINVRTGVVSQVDVPEGLVLRNTGTVGNGWHLITSDGKYIYNLAYSVNSRGYNGWTIRVFDPKDEFKLIKEMKINGSSYYTDGLLCDGKYLYPIEWRARNTARITRIRVADGKLMGQWTINQGDTDVINGQYDFRHNKFYLGALRYGKIYRYSANGFINNDDERFKDNDGDGIINDIELELGLDPDVSNADTDTDEDGVKDKDEVLTYKTNPFLADTDSDGTNDSDEIANGTNPLVDENMIDSPHKDTQEELYATEGISGAGVVATDGKYLYVKRWAGYPGSNSFIKIGTGYNNTVAGKNYGALAAGARSLSAAYHSDGFIYNPTSNAYKIERIHVVTGVKTLADVPDGLLLRNTGKVQNGWQIITSDGKFLYNLAYSINGGGYNGWTIRIFDPKDNFTLINELKISSRSYYTDGLLSDGKYLYPIEWRARNNARITRIRISDGKILGQWTINQGDTDVINGQYDFKNNKFWLGALRGGRLYKYTAKGLTNNSDPLWKDPDEDGIVTFDELSLGLDPDVKNEGDLDNDGLLDVDEVLIYGTHPLKSDTDGDSINDGAEIAASMDPLADSNLFDSPQKQYEETNVATENSVGAGIVTTDGTYLYIKRWAGYSGSDDFVKIGTGYNGTELGKNYGALARGARSLSATYFSNGYIYNPKSQAHYIERINVTTGAKDEVSVPDGLLTRNTGYVGGGWQMITSDGKYLYNLAYSINRGGYNGWTIRVFDPTDNFKLIEENKIHSRSYYTDGLLCDGKYLYPIEWRANNSARITRISISNWEVLGQWTINQGDNDVINGQYDWVNNKFWLGALRYGVVYKYSASGLWRFDESLSSMLNKAIVYTDNVLNDQAVSNDIKADVQESNDNFTLANSFIGTSMLGQVLLLADNGIISLANAQAKGLLNADDIQKRMAMAVLMEVEKYITKLAETYLEINKFMLRARGHLAKARIELDNGKYSSSIAYSRLAYDSLALLYEPFKNTGDLNYKVDVATTIRDEIAETQQYYNPESLQSVYDKIEDVIEKLVMLKNNMLDNTGGMKLYLVLNELLTDLRNIPPEELYTHYWQAGFAILLNDLLNMSLTVTLNFEGASEDSDVKTASDSYDQIVLNFDDGNAESAIQVFLNIKCLMLKIYDSFYVPDYADEINPSEHGCE